MRKHFQPSADIKEGSTAPAGSPRRKSSEIDNIKEGSTTPNFDSDLRDGDSDGEGDGDGDVDGKEGSIAPHFGISTEKRVAQPHLMKAMAMESMMESAVSQMVQLIEVVLQMATMMVL